MKDNYKWVGEGMLLPAQRSESGNYNVTYQGALLSIRERNVRVQGDSIEDLFSDINQDEFMSFTITRVEPTDIYTAEFLTQTK